MYPFDVAALRGFLAARPAPPARPVIVRTVWLLGLVSCFTDISSEMISSILPVYLFVHLQLSPVQFGLIDGLYQGVTAVARLASGIVADRWRRYKLVATIGYALSAVCKLGLLATGSAWSVFAAVLSADRLGKGIRTAPRDALISLTTRPQDLASAFGVHRAMDTAGVLVGPLLAYWILASMPGRFDAIFVISFAAALIGIAVLVLLVDDRRGSRRRARDVACPSIFRACCAIVRSSRLPAWRRSRASSSSATRFSICCCSGDGEAAPRRFHCSTRVPRRRISCWPRPLAGWPIASDERVCFCSDRC